MEMVIEYYELSDDGTAVQLRSRHRQGEEKDPLLMHIDDEVFLDIVAKGALLTASSIAEAKGIKEEVVFKRLIDKLEEVFFDKKYKEDFKKLLDIDPNDTET